MSVDEEADMIFTEYLVNDGFTNVVLDNDKVITFERLAR